MVYIGKSLSIKKITRKESEMKESKNVLIVEDEILIALNLKRDLERYGYGVRDIIASGEEAIRCMESDCPLIVLLDIRLAGVMNGLEVARKIYKRHGRLGIIFMTGYITPEIKEEALSLDPLAFLEKPITARDILRIIKPESLSK